MNPHAFSPFVRLLGRGKTLSRGLDANEAETAFGMILDGEALPEQIGAFLMLLRMKEETGAEIAGFVRAARARLPVTMELGSRTPGALRDWCADRGLPAITYEVEHAGLPALGARHLPALEWLVRGWRPSPRRPG